MNDTTTNDMPVTMHEPAVPSVTMPFPEFELMASLLKALNTHIETLVDKRFAALVESHRTLALMDEDMEQRISHMIDDAIENHESDKDHKNDADIEHEVSNHVEYYLRQGDHQFVTERELNEKVSDALDEVLEEKVQDLLRNASVEITL